MGYCITLLCLYIFYFFPQHFLYFFPEPHGHGSLGYIFLSVFTALPPNPSGYIFVDMVSEFASRSTVIPYEAYYQALQSLNVKVGQFYLTINMLLTKNAEKLGTETFIKETYGVDDAEA